MYEEYLKLLKELIQFKSISTDAAFKPDILKTVEWIKEMFEEKKFNVEVVEGFGNPLIIASYVAEPSYKTALVYGHYDVQPASIEEGWNSEPFEVNERDGRIFARGAVDNKGQFLIHVSSIFNLIKEGELKYNVKFLLEGDEETGSGLIDKFFDSKKDALKADFVLFSDGEQVMTYPGIDVGYRGIFNIEVTIKTSNKDNHSGLYGGSIPNSARVLANILSKMHDENEVLKLEGIDNTLHNVAKELVENNKQIPYQYDDFLKFTEANTRLNKDSIDYFSQVGLLTSAEITTLKSGYMGEGFRNAIAGTSTAKINFRISPQHDTQKVMEAFISFLKKNTPEYAELTYHVEASSSPIKLDLDNEYVVKAKTLLEELYSKKAFFVFCGAIVPITGLFKDILNIPVISVGLANEDCNMHGANENFEIDLVKKGLEFSRRIFSTSP